MSAKEDPEFFRLIGRYFVALTCRQKLPGTIGIGTYFAASGFILSVDNNWFLITAGHIFKEIEEAKRQGVQFINWQLDDTFALAKKRPVNVDGPGVPETIPFDIDAQVFKMHYCEDNGSYDYAFIYLEPYYVSLLRANGVMPFEEEHWVITEERPANRVELVGVPNDQIKELSISGLVQKRLVSVPLYRVNDDPENSERYQHMLFARVPNISASGLEGFEKIQGMSGGPIIGFWTQPDGTERMRIIAIQNMWNSSQETVFGHPVAHVADHLQNTIKALQDEAERHSR